MAEKPKLDEARFQRVLKSTLDGALYGVVYRVAEEMAAREWQDGWDKGYAAGQDDAVIGHDRRPQKGESTTGGTDG